MVSYDIELNRLFSWSCNFDIDPNENILRIVIHVGVGGGEYTGVVGDREYHAIPDVATVNRLNNIRAQIKTVLENTVLLEGSILDIYEVQEVVVPEQTVLELVKIQ